MTERLDGAPVAERVLQKCRETVAAGRAQGLPVPVLASVHLGASTPFQFYLKRQGKAAATAGIEFRSTPLQPGSGPKDLDTLLSLIDSDTAIHGAIVEHPLPAPFDFEASVSRLRPEKDTDGVGWSNLGHLLSGRPRQVPAVALAALAILEHYAIPLAGHRITVLGRSPTVGLPLAVRLLARGPGGDATVTVAHSRTPDLAATLSGSEVVISCVGQPGLLTRKLIPKGATVIDVGLSSVPDPSKPGGMRAVGDADLVDLDGWAGALTPTPGGVGPVTVSELMANAVHGWELLHAGGSG
ncbi:MAG TPA: bifunctional 5,10-methylenetetrahydrofolate dehydrogenase/5,10-methenyltetrahydrofolate cyclohydrolase [Thermoplasmata archaeon]|nr:bifunctional 5,10-methylenetetrahydrofolate dehydrogenase/5,10-methenyltetrahydrofolate cyclohydrolase [Thermoplasmata archaeon]